MEYPVILYYKLIILSFSLCCIEHQPMKTYGENGGIFPCIDDFGTILMFEVNFLVKINSFAPSRRYNASQSQFEPKKSCSSGN